MLSNIVIKFVHFTIKADFQFLKHIILLQFFKILLCFILCNLNKKLRSVIFLLVT